MRWIVKPKPVPTSGNKRVKKRFLFWPKTLWTRDSEKLQRRWLEFASWDQVFHRLSGIDNTIEYWTDIGWVDN